MRLSWRVLFVIGAVLLSSIAVANFLVSAPESQTITEVPEEITEEKKRTPRWRGSGATENPEDEKQPKAMPTHVPLPEVFIDPPPPILDPGSSATDNAITPPRRESGLGALSRTIGELFTGKEETKEEFVKETPEPDREPIVDQGSRSEDDIREDLLSAAGGPPVPEESPPPEREQPTSSPTPEPSPTQAPLLPWVFGQSRGYTMLYAMQPEARTTVEAEIKILLDARVRDIYIGVLTDGTFGWNPEYLSDIVRRLNREGRNLTLALYLTNGPTMRRFDTTEIETDFSKIDPEEFRELIKNDPVVQETYRQLARRTLPIFSLNRSLGRRNQNIVIPMLEDNLDGESFSSMAQITQEILGGVATIIRNPCPGCYEGNDAERVGVRLEIHGEGDLPLASRGDGYSLDGTGYRLSEESIYERALPVRQLKSLLEISLNGGFSYFGLWREDRQGLRPGSAPALPSLRTYAIPTPEQKIIEIELLRFNLREETPNEES